MRDLGQNPYSADEQRIATWFANHGIGGGEDPVTAILTSHEFLAAERKQLRAALDQALAALDELHYPTADFIRSTLTAPE